MSSVYKPENVIRLGKDFVWPGDKKVAVVIDVAYECWSDGSYSGIGRGHVCRSYQGEQCYFLGQVWCFARNSPSFTNSETTQRKSILYDKRRDS